MYRFRLKPHTTLTRLYEYEYLKHAKTTLTRIQGYLVAKKKKMCTGIGLDDVAIIRKTTQYTTATSLIKNNY